MSTFQKIIDRANDLARKLYECDGYVAPDGWRFDKSTHPRELRMWRMAVIAFDHCESIDIDDVLSMLEEDDG